MNAPQKVLTVLAMAVFVGCGTGWMSANAHAVYPSRELPSLLVTWAMVAVFYVALFFVLKSRRN